MRKLKTSDLFAFARCLKDIGLKDEIKKIAMEANNVGDIAEKGFDYFYILFEKVTDNKSEQAIYEFLSGIFEMTPEEVEKMDPIEWLDNLTKIADFNAWKTFFTTAARLMK
jgi:hypothetical protein